MGYGSTDTFNPSTSPTGKAVTVPTPEEEEDEFSSLLRPLTREEIIQEVLKEKDNIPTGFYLKDGNREIELKLPTGGLTIIAGRTSHRKTGTMLNLCREVVDRIGEEGGRVLFLSYEESDMNIQLKLLNLIVNMESLDPTAQLDNKEYIKAYYRGTLKGTEAFRRAEEKFYRDYIDTYSPDFSHKYWYRSTCPLLDVPLISGLVENIQLLPNPYPAQTHLFDYMISLCP